MILLKHEIQKGLQPVNEKRLQELIQQQQPQIVRFLARLWNRQQSDIGYAELREAIESGTVSLERLAQWRQDYSGFVVGCLMPQWKMMMLEAVSPLQDKFTQYRFDPAAGELLRYTSAHAAELVTYSTARQLDAIQALVQRAAVVQDISVDELARQIRPTIGLYKQQAVSNLNYYRTVRNNLLKEHPSMRLKTATDRARLAAIRYGERQHRYRAMMIARTELAFAHNAGCYGGMLQAQEQGLIGKVQKQWITAESERTCEGCQALDMVTVEMDAHFPGTASLLPPKHPHCMCVVNYIEV